ncbi:ran family small GTPase [Naegleria gruberi]|uniref:Ran family small GTPase n=1 Tax=Naegleria gruberi TaxID=5762 RepID=D2VTJ2_NAEGR|nr:ran family small GTPase [Naegleria gruberi]EFC39869.1 ran family small GTPase [Naegleria gruberi]|eukprot:XP_002672613.1 ran family small GTPase [Naegleria gruberi strain NEG-M]
MELLEESCLLSVINLPKEIWLYQICEYLDILDMIFSLGRVCKAFRYELANEYLKKFPKTKKKDSNDQVSSIDSFSMRRVKYIIRDELLKFIVKFEKSLTNEGIFEKKDTSHVSEQSNAQQNDPKSTNGGPTIEKERLMELFQSRMEIFDFYFSHFYKKLPSDASESAIKQTSIASSLFKSENQLVESSSARNTEMKKILIIGNGGVGKTTFCRSMQDLPLNDNRNLPTIGCEINSYRLKIAGLEANINLWDTVGQEKFGFLRDTLYVNTSVCIICFDLTSRYSYKSILNWFRDIKRVEPECEVIFVGTKLDLTDNLKVTPKQITFPINKYCPYIGLSSLQQINNRAVLWYVAFMNLFVSHLKGIHETLICDKETIN